MLRFCRDGVLRINKSVYNRFEKKHYSMMIPLIEMEKRYPGKFLSVLENSFELEDGIDVKEVLLNLEPWTTEVSAICHCNFKLFLDEVKKSSSEQEDLETIAFTYIQSVKAEPDFDHSLFEDLFERIPGSRMSVMKEMTPIITDRIEIERGYWHCCGFTKGTEDFLDYDNNNNGYGMSLSPLSKWHHMKVKVVDHYWLYDETPESDYLTFKDGFINSSFPGIVENRNDQGQLYNRRIKIMAPEPTLLGVILKGLVWDIGFHGSPDEIAAFSDSLKESMDECDADRVLQDIIENDPVQLEEIEAQIAAEIAKEKVEEMAKYEANPYDENDLYYLGMIKEIIADDPKAIISDELPTSLKIPSLKIVK